MVSDSEIDRQRDRQINTMTETGKDRCINRRKNRGLRRQTKK